MNDAMVDRTFPVCPEMEMLIHYRIMKSVLVDYNERHDLHAVVVIKEA